MIGLAYAGVLGALAAAMLCACAALVLAEHGRRLAGERFGLCAGAAIVVLPLLGVPYALPHYRPTYTHAALPALVGATHTGWFAAGVAVAAGLLAAPRLALAASGVAALLIGLAVWGVDALGAAKAGLHETSWSVTFAAWLVVAGVVGVARRSPWLATCLAGWFGLVLLRAAHEPFDGGRFWIALAPAAPAAALLFVAISLLVPRLRAQPAAHAR